MNLHSNHPSISIVMPLYNKENEVRRAIDSVLAQTFTDFELIVVNDGSTDNGPDMVRSVKDQRIRLFDQENSGVSAARNRGIEESKSDLIAFLDADDEWKSEFLETIMRLKTNQPGCTVFATNYFYRDSDGTYRKPIYRGIPADQWEGVLHYYFAVASRSDPPLSSSAIAIEKKSLLEIGGFPTGIKSGEDLLTWARLAVTGKIAYSTSTEAVYWLKTKLTEMRLRTPDTIDVVGEELKKLLGQIDKEQLLHLKRYIGIWHKMRAVQFMMIPMQKTARQEIKKACYYIPGSLLLRYYQFIISLPPSLGLKGLFLLKTINNFRRK